MKVMVIGPTEPDTFADNVGVTLEALGHDVHLAGPVRPRSRLGVATKVRQVAQDKLASYDARTQRHLVDAARAQRPDLVIAVDRRMRPVTVRAVRATGAKVVLWFPDAVTNLDRHEMFVAGYDRLYFKNPLLVAQLNEIYGLPIKLLPEAANPMWHRPLGGYGTEKTIVVAGNLHPTRALLLERLLEAGIPLKIYGAPLPSWLDFPRVRAAHTGEYVARETKARAFRSARGVLNNLHPAEFAGGNCRLFEATASGAAVITEWRDGMQSLYKRDEEVLTFGSFDELLLVCRRLLGDPAPGSRVGDAAARRAAADHTYQQRLETMFADLTLD